MSKQLRVEILLALEEHARSRSPKFVADAELSTRFQKPVDEIQRQLDILESQGLISSANSFGGHAARITPQGSLVVEELEEGLEEPASPPIGFGNEEK